MARWNRLDQGIAFALVEVVALIWLKKLIKTLKQHGVFSPDGRRASSLPRTSQRSLKYVFTAGRLGGLLLGDEVREMKRNEVTIWVG
jgi:hypothetical protein